MKIAALKYSKGFTLIELLVVIGILAVLLSITLIAINPGKQFSQANDTKRRSDVNAILNAINQYAADNQGQLPGSLTATACPSTTPCQITGVVGTSNIDLCPTMVTKYLSAFPRDPLVSGGAPISTCDALYDAGYIVSLSSSDNRVTVTAPQTENGPDISVTR